MVGWINRVLRTAFFFLIVRPIILVVVGLNVRHRERLPKRGPAILVANHNSHLDTMVLMSLFSMKQLKNIRPAAAADYFLRNRLLAWFSHEIIGIVPVARARSEANEDLLAPVARCLSQGYLLIFFPEGTRGEPEKLAEFKSGIARLAERFPEVPIVPFFIHGLGKVLPRGELVLVPFFCDVFVGEEMKWNGDKIRFLEELKRRLESLAAEGSFPAWD